jgi:holdfast attachment protein HfaA
MNRVALAAALFAAVATPVMAQASSRALPTAASMGGGVAGSMTGQPTDYSLRDGNGNLIIVNGVLRPAGSMSATGGFADSPLPMAGGQTATAVANQLTVLATGSWNTIIVDSVQTNTGDVTATAGSTSQKDH